MWSLHCQDRQDASADRLCEKWLAKGFLWKSHCLRKHLIPGHVLQSHSGVSAADNLTVLRSQPQLPSTATSYVLGLSLPEGNCFSAPQSFPKLRGPDWVLSKHTESTDESLYSGDTLRFMGKGCPVSNHLEASGYASQRSQDCQVASKCSLRVISSLLP